MRLVLQLFVFSTNSLLLQTAALATVFSSFLTQVENIAKRGGFGTVLSVHLHAAQKSLDLVMTATWRASAYVAQPLGSGDHREMGMADAPHTPGHGGTQFVASCRLRVTAKVQPG